MSVGTTYVYKRTDTDNLIARIVLIFFAIAIPIGCIYMEVKMHNKFSAIKEIADSSIPVSTPTPYTTGKNVYFISEPAVVPAIRDSDFNIEGRGLVFKRTVEYCQWIQHEITREEKESDGTTTVTKTYYYTKEWVSSPIPSFLYSDALTHMNPSRAPFYSKTSYPDFPVPLKNGYSIQDSMLEHLVAESKQVSLEEKDLFKFSQSTASLREKFTYIGDGWFYSAYEPHFFESMIRVMNFQLYDLFSKCTAGDIRAGFSVMNPSVLSVAGKQATDNGIMSTSLASNNVELALLHEGAHSPTELASRIIKSLKWKLYVSRALFGIYLVVAGVFAYNYHKKAEKTKTIQFIKQSIE